MVLTILLAYVDRISHKLNQGWKQEHDQRELDHKGNKESLYLEYTHPIGRENVILT